LALAHRVPAAKVPHRAEVDQAVPMASAPPVAHMVAVEEVVAAAPGAVALLE
jgi:hypothetical protein